MIPTQLSIAKKEMSAVLKEMYNNLNFYYEVTGPLHNHKSFDKQLALVVDIMTNLTHLSEDMTQSKDELDKIEENLHNEADSHFKDNDHLMTLDT
mmetsp:Transcript_3572/g.5408  ORF Transcript_3572/g.5408 Transcript_3572/m.5408 type:complete len:95 (-) Transcript_3572:457-741(-)